MAANPSEGSSSPSASFALLSVDTQVQQTNDDSIVSKRSAGKHGYVNDHYLRHFVRKVSRRAPLINRGYYLRIVAMAEIVRQSVNHVLLKSVGHHGNETSSGDDKESPGTHKQKVQVLSLGAGFDTFAMREYNTWKNDSVAFFEVDFPAVIRNKVMLMAAAGNDAFPFGDLRIDAEQGEAHAFRFHSIGLDLRDADRSLLSSLEPHGFDAMLPTVVYAECVTQYMSLSCSDGLCSWVSANLPLGVYYSYDQIRPNDSFGHVMTGALKSRCSPLVGISTLPDAEALSARAVRCGLHVTRIASFYDLSGHIIQGAELQRVQQLEPFDEHEEWAEMCDHYVIVGAARSSELYPCAAACPYLKATQSMPEKEAQTSVPTLEAAVENWPIGRCCIEGWGSEVICDKAAGTPFFVSYGGCQSTKGAARGEGLLVHSLRDGDIQVVVIPSEAKPPPTSFHTFTKLQGGTYMLFGGRTNPNRCFADVFLCRLATFGFPERTTAEWLKADLQVAEGSAPCPRFRHFAAFLPLQNVLIVYGGCTASGTVLNDVWALSFDGSGPVAWSSVHVTGDAVPSLCSVAGCVVSSDEESRRLSTVGVCGGLENDKSCSGDIGVFRVVINAENRIDCSYTRHVNLISPRFSHAACSVVVNGRLAVAVVGGAAFSSKGHHTTKAGRAVNQPMQLISPDYDSHWCGRLTVASCHTDQTSNVAQQTLIRCTATEIAEGTVAVIGGGFTCFSFGNAFVKPFLLRFGPARTLFSDVPSAALESDAHSLQSIVPFTDEAWTRCSRDKPVLFTKTPLGCCVKEWSNKEYLRTRVGATMVLVHSAPRSHYLDFVHKNFSFKNVYFAELLDHVFTTATNDEQDRETWYFRSVGMTARAQSDYSSFYRDFPSIASDVKLPASVESVVFPRLQQSVLRINQKSMQLWTHYDTLDNILCQIVGQKRVVLFPPDQYTNLYMEGSSSRVVNLDEPNLERFPRFAEAMKHAIHFVLNPGDVLCIPAMWLHHVTAIDACISINFFYETLPKAMYDPKDMYGNKDLPAAVKARTDLVAMAKFRFLSGGVLPPPHDEFALRQAIAELEQLADNLAMARRP